MLVILFRSTSIRPISINILPIQHCSTKSNRLIISIRKLAKSSSIANRIANRIIIRIANRIIIRITNRIIIRIANRIIIRIANRMMDI